MKKTALIIEDNKKNLLLETDLLELAGFKVFAVENATDGIAIAKKEKPNIIIMDIRLPDIRGTEAANMLRQNESTRDIPIVFVTASIINTDKKNMLNITNSKTIYKPLNTRTFAKEISDTLTEYQKNQSIKR